MPIYEYECNACGHQHEALQKLGAEPLVICPACSEPELKKKISAAGFRLKGGGWYETDFKSGSKKNVAFKLYPAGATTHSTHGVTDITSVYPVFAAMEELDVLLLVHAEVADSRYDVFDREKIFLDGPLTAIRRQFPALRIVVEHLTT